MKAQTILRWIGCVVLVGAVWEGCARLDDWWMTGAPFWARYDSSLLYDQDESGIHGRPGARYLKWKINQQGFRGPELRENRERILVVGASETFGLFESEGHEYPRLLEQELNRRAGRERFEIVNAAYPGQGLPAFQRRLPRIAAQVRPRWALIYPSLANYIDPPPPFPAPPLPRPGPVQLRIADRIDTVMKRSLPMSWQTEMKKLVIWKTMRGRAVWQQVPAAHAERFRQDLDSLLKALAGLGIQPVLVTHATRFGAEVKPEERFLLTSWRRFYPQLDENGFLPFERQLNGILRERCAEAGIPVIDAARSMAAGPAMFVDFVHFTDAGAVTMARLLADGLQKSIFNQ